MAELNLSQSDVARRADLKRDNLSNWVSGKVMPRPRMLERLSSALACAPSDLMPNLPQHPMPSLPQEQPAQNGMPAFVASYLRGGKMRIQLNIDLPIEAAAPLITLVEKALAAQHSGEAK